MQRFAGLVRPQGTVLDVACGSGRHLRWLAAQGFAVTGVDRDAGALAGLADLGSQVELHQADIESGPWPWPGRRFDAVVVSNYLWRALWPQLLDALGEGGVLIYETFADGQQHIGRPLRPDFLLQPGELLRVCAGLRVVAYEDGFEDGSEKSQGAARCVQRIAAVAENEALAEALQAPRQPPRLDPRRYALSACTGALACAPVSAPVSAAMPGG